VGINETMVAVSEDEAIRSEQKEKVMMNNDETSQLLNCFGNMTDTIGVFDSKYRGWM
jgi:glycerol-3-phosphate cytidylyltransferase-like family protein